MKVENRNIKYPRIELRTGELHFILPMGMNYQPIMDKYEGWITEKKEEINKALKQSTKLKLVSRSPEFLLTLTKMFVEEYSKKYGIVCNRIMIRNLRSKWGSCGSNANLTFNKLIAFLPDRYLEYVVFHELMHLIERKHTPEYWALISEKFPNYKQIEEELLSYWFLINKKGKG